MTNRLLTAAEIAERIGVSRSQVYKMWNDGILPFIVIGRDKRMPEAALDEWLVTALTTNRK